MSIRDALLPLIGQSSRSTMAAIEKCVAMSRGLDVRVTALAIETEDAAPQGVADVLGATEIVQTAPTAQGLLAAFGAAAMKLSLRNEQRLERTAGGAMIDMIARQARLHDIAIDIVRTADPLSEELVERLLFETGRPVLMCPEEMADSLAARFDEVAVAWDHSAPAARAIADALPLLRRASRVRIVTATDEVTAALNASGEALKRHLAEHRIKAGFEIIGIDGRPDGKVFEQYVEDNGIDLLVMGGYRHSRLNELIWGGVTSTVINRPPCWVLLSH